MTRISMLAAGAAAFVVGGSALADTLLVPLTGFQATDFFGDLGNSSISVPLAAGSQITGIDFLDLTFESFGNSLTQEFVVSVNDTPAALLFWDSVVPGSGNANGVLGPVNAPFANPGQFGSGPFTTTSGNLYIEVYDLFGDAGLDAQVLTGGIAITYTPIPGPGALALLAMGAAMRGRRRRA
jgi:uncharacterized protein (TIGR03382 family)